MSKIKNNKKNRIKFDKENNNENTISSESENGIVIGRYLISIHRIMDRR